MSSTRSGSKVSSRKILCRSLERIELRVLEDLLESIEVEGLDAGSVATTTSRLNTIARLRERVCGKLECAA